MAAALEPGMWVICVNAGTIPGQTGGEWTPGDRLTEGAFYQVSDCFVSALGRPHVELVGKDRSDACEEWGTRVGYDVARFRPLLDGPSQELIEQLKAPPQSAPTRETEAA